MDIKELDKKQLILLTLLITFVVSIATGIVTVSLMNQMPKSVPQTINNVIQRTIEKVTTVEVPAPGVNDSTVANKDNQSNNNSLFINNSDALVSVYLKKSNPITIPTDAVTTSGAITIPVEPTAIGQGIIISDIGLILIDSSLINDTDSYKVVLDKKDFDISVLKKFNNGFTVLKISATTDKPKTNTEASTKTQ
jgi:hypothetical protein